MGLALQAGLDPWLPYPASWHARSSAHSTCSGTVLHMVPTLSGSGCEQQAGLTLASLGRMLHGPGLARVGAVCPDWP